MRLISLPQYLGGEVRTGLLLPSAATVCLLLITCTNAAGLLLARGQRRMAEIAMRSAPGASKPRLIRLMLTEIGVRLAMGSTRAGIVGLVIRRGAWIVTAGLMLGLAGAYPGTMLVHDLLFETVPLDPATYTGAVLLPGLVAAAACLVPALRAMRVDPAIVLRNE